MHPAASEDESSSDDGIDCDSGRSSNAGSGGGGCGGRGDPCASASLGKLVELALRGGGAALESPGPEDARVVSRSSDVAILGVEACRKEELADLFERKVATAPTEKSSAAPLSGNQSAAALGGQDDREDLDVLDGSVAAGQAEVKQSGPKQPKMALEEEGKSACLGPDVAANIRGILEDFFKSAPSHRSVHLLFFPVEDEVKRMALASEIRAQVEEEGLGERREDSGKNSKLVR